LDPHSIFPENSARAGEEIWRERNKERELEVFFFPFGRERVYFVKKAHLLGDAFAVLPLFPSSSFSSSSEENRGGWETGRVLDAAHF
jgi:hypothetical protein